MSEQSKELKELIDYNEVLENYFRNTIIPQLYVDGSLKLRKFTPPALTQFNLSINDIGKSVHEIIDTMRFPTLEQNILYVMRTNEILEKEVQTTDFRWYQMNILPYVKIKDNKTDGVIITFVEITMRIKDLKEQEKMIAENALLLDTLSHDLRGPLSNLTTLLALFKSISPTDEAEFNSLYSMVDIALQNMKRLITELTQARKKEHEQLDVAELVNIEHILEDVRLSLSENIVATNTKISSEIQVSEMLFSRRKLRTVLYNLINNAIKFRTPGKPPEILVSTFMEKDIIVLSVRDNGIGIDESKTEGIFLKYKRLDNDIEGSGIGLYLVKEIVSKAGGEIEVVSNPNGTEFKIYISSGQ